MSVDPKTGMVAQGYKAVSKDELDAYVKAYVETGRELSEVWDATLNIDAFEDKGVGRWPEGVMAYTSRRTGLHYVRDDANDFQWGSQEEAMA